MFRRQQHRIKENVIEENLDYLVRFAFFRLADREEAEDVVHEAVLRFLEQKPSKISGSGLRSYLFRIVYNLCQDSLRNQRQRPLAIETVDVAEPTDSDILDSEEADRLNRLLNDLPQREAEVIRMNVIDELSFVEISDILSIPPSTAKSRFKAGMDKIRQKYLSQH
jgi:RNA polymerase sigma-70 factor (ECF subfamily)